LLTAFKKFVQAPAFLPMSGNSTWHLSSCQRGPYGGPPRAKICVWGWRQKC